MNSSIYSIVDTAAALCRTAAVFAHFIADICFQVWSRPEAYSGRYENAIAEFFGKLLDRRTAIAIDRNSGWVAKWHIIALEVGIAISVKVQRPARYDYLLQIWQQELNPLLESFCSFP
ncbi:MAG: hypothetical protein V8T47_10330 [Oscillospiraceae bacterium]